MEEFFGNAVSLLRAAIAIIVVLYVPGRALAAWLFPHGSLDAVERSFVAVATSIALSSMTAAVLVVWVPGGLSAYRFLFAIGILTLACSAGAYGRRRNAAGAPGGQDAHGSGSSRLITALMNAPKGLALPFLLLLVALGAMLVSRPSLRLPPKTEFYILPSDLDAVLAAQPNTPGELRIPVTIGNLDTRDVSYRIEAWDDEAMVSELRAIEVDSGAKRDVTVELPRPGASEGSVVELRLIDESTPEPADVLRLSVALDARK